MSLQVARAIWLACEGKQPGYHKNQTILAGKLGVENYASTIITIRMKRKLNLPLFYLGFKH